MIQWRKSSYSDDEQSLCVEAANLGDAIGLRDSKHPERGHQAYGRRTFAALVIGLKAKAR